MYRIAGPPHNDITFHSFDIQRELSLTFPAGAKRFLHKAMG
jgi:hypothetical protein